MAINRFAFILFCCLILGQKSLVHAQNDSTTAEALYSEAGDLFTAQKYDSAIIVAEQAVDLFRQQKHYSRMMDAYGTKAQSILMRDGAEKAIGVLDDVALVGEELMPKYHIGWAEIYYQYGSCYQELGVFNKAVEYAEKGIDLRDNIELPASKKARLEWGASRIFASNRQLIKAREYAYDAKDSYLEAYPDTSQHFYGVTGTLADIYLWESENDSAMHYSRISIKGCEQIYGPDHFNLGVMHNQIAGIYDEICQFDRAIKHYKIAMAIMIKHKKKTGKYIYENIVKTNLSLVYYDLHEYELAEKYSLESLPGDIAYYGRYSPQLAFPLGRLITIYHAQEKIQEAQQYVDHMAAILENNPDLGHANQCYIISFLLGQAVNLRKEDEARKHFREYLAAYEKSGENINKVYVATVAEMGKLYGVVGEIDSCVFYLDQAIAGFKKTLSPRSNAVLIQYTQKARYLLADKLNKAEEALDSALICLFYPRTFENTEDYLKNLPPQPNAINAFEMRIRILYKKKASDSGFEEEFERAIAHYDRFIENSYAAIRSQSRVEDLAKINDRIYGLAIKHYLDKTNIEKAFEYAEKSRSLSIRLALNQYESQNHISTPKEVRQKETDLLRRIRNMNIAAEEEPDSAYDVESYLNTIEEYYDFKKMIKQKHPTYYRLKYAIDALDLNTIKSKLKDSQSLVSFRQVDSTLYAFLLSDGKLQAHQYPNERINNEVERLNKSLNKGKFTPEIAQNLYAFLINPIEHALDKKDIIIIPDGALNYLSFDLLIDENDQWLLNRYNISTAIATDLIFATATTSSEKEWISFVPGFTENIKRAYMSTVDSTSEVDSAYLMYIKQPSTLKFSASLAGIAKSKSYTELEATEGVFKRTTINAPLLFIGTHAELNDQEPAFSRFVMTKDTSGSTDDGYLHAYELYGKELSTDLAILSACNTGTGVLKQGEGLMSLSHAFSYAGCPSLLVTKWNVDEQSTINIIEKFLRNIKNGMSKNNALSAAKKEFLQEAPAELQSPYYWAGLQLIGDPDPIYGDTPRWLYLLMSGLMAGAGLVIYRRSRKT